MQDLLQCEVPLTEQASMYSLWLSGSFALRSKILPLSEQQHAATGQSVAPNAHGTGATGNAHSDLLQSVLVPRSS
jgi:hypothetical protein